MKFETLAIATPKVKAVLYAVLAGALTAGQAQLCADQASVSSWQQRVEEDWLLAERVAVLVGHLPAAQPTRTRCLAGR